MPPYRSSGGSVVFIRQLGREYGELKAAPMSPRLDASVYGSSDTIYEIHYNPTLLRGVCPNPWRGVAGVLAPAITTFEPPEETCLRRALSASLLADKSRCLAISISNSAFFENSLSCILRRPESSKFFSFTE